jgi:hypothetical protein
MGNVFYRHFYIFCRNFSEVGNILILLHSSIYYKEIDAANENERGCSAQM